MGRSEDAVRDMGTGETYLLLGSYPDGMVCRLEVTAYDDKDVMAVAQGLRKVTTMHTVSVWSQATGRLIFKTSLYG